MGLEVFFCTELWQAYYRCFESENRYVEFDPVLPNGNGRLSRVGKEFSLISYVQVGPKDFNCH